MIIVMKQGAPAPQIEEVVRRVEELGYKVHLSRGEARTIIGVVGADEHKLTEDTFNVFDGVEKTMRVMAPYRMASRDFTQMDSIIDVRGVKIGGKAVTARRAQLFYLPPYSPDLNPIEMAFAKLKALLRQDPARTIDTLVDRIGTLLDRFHPAECANFFQAAGYQRSR